MFVSSTSSSTLGAANLSDRISLSQSDGESDTYFVNNVISNQVMGVSYIGGSGQTFASSTDTVYCIQPQGPQGTQGPNGPQGANGVQGFQGPGGPQGPEGSGTQGAEGSGTQGTQGPAGSSVEGTRIVVAEGSMHVRGGLPRYDADPNNSTWLVSNVGNTAAAVSAGLGWASSEWSGNVAGAGIIAGASGTDDLFWLMPAGIVLQHSYVEGDKFTYRATWTSHSTVPFVSTARIGVALFRWQCSGEVLNGEGTWEQVSNQGTSSQMAISNIGDSFGRAYTCMNTILTISAAAGTGINRFTDRLMIGYATNDNTSENVTTASDMGCTWKLIEGEDQSF